MKKYISTVSRNIDPRQTGYESVVFQTGKSVLDSELNLSRDLATDGYKPSGVISKNKDISVDYVFNQNPNVLGISAFDVRVANRQLRVAYTNNTTELNKITLPNPPSSGKRTDFVFLEVWRSLVHPSVAATAKIRVLGTIASGDTITFDNGVDPATSFVCDTDFDLGVSVYITALNLANAINTNGLADADSRGTDFVFITFPVGASSNSFIISADASISIIQQPAGGSDGNGKPSSDKIYLYGNTQSNSTVWLSDDTLDPLVNRETTKRVQFQYKFRVIENVDYTVNPDGFSSTIYSRGGTNVDSSYEFKSSNANYPYQDSGLWVAGNGDQTSATALNSVDGFSYAIPICFVNRRNTGGFIPLTNVNGALLSTHTGATSLYIYPPATTALSAGVSDRPDGLFADIVVKTDILDLRKKVVGHVDLHKELEYQFQSLLDTNYKTWQIDGSDLYEIGGGSGDVSHTPLVCDQIGTTASPYGNEIGKFDHIRRRFSAHPTIERVVIEVLPNTSTPFVTVVPSPELPGRTKWHAFDEIQIDFTKLDVTQDYASFNLTSGSPVYFTNVMPANTQVIDVIEMWHDDGNTTSAIDTNVVISAISGLGSNQISIELFENPNLANGGVIGDPTYKLVGRFTGISTPIDEGSVRRIFIALAVSYTEGNGLTATPSATDFIESGTAYGQGSIIESDTANRPTDIIGQDEALEYAVRDGYREWLIEYVGDRKTDTLVSLNSTTIRVPYKAYGLVPSFSAETNPNKIYRNILDNTYNPEYREGANPYAYVGTASEFGSSSGLLTLNSPLSGAQVLVDVKYNPLGALNTQNKVMLYYRSLGPQTSGSKAGVVTDIVPNPLELEPLVASNNMYSIQVGKGSNDVSYPYYSPSDLIPTLSSLNLKEWELKATGNISTGDFNISTGLLRIGALTPVDISSDLTFSGVDKDADSRVLYNTFDLVATYTTPLSSATVHKTVLPLLCKVKTGSVLFREGEVVMVIYSRLSNLEGSNYIAPNDRSVVSVYATKNRIVVGE